LALPIVVRFAMQNNCIYARFPAGSFSGAVQKIPGTSLNYLAQIPLITREVDCHIINLRSPLKRKEIKMQDFTHSAISPAFKSQVEAQFSFFSDVTNKIFNAVQKLNELNVQVAQTVVEESLSNAQQLISSKDHHDAISVVAGQAQPAAEKLRAYQQHVQNILAETQVNLAKTAESHLPETTRAAEAIVKEVAQKASEETEKSAQRQRAAMEKLTNPINKQPSSSASSGAARANA
jgi:phasin family protein